MSCLLPQIKCLPDSFAFKFKTHNHPSSQLPKHKDPIFFRTRCILSTVVPPVSTESTVLNLEKLHLSLLEVHSNSDSADRPWSSSTTRVLDNEKLQFPSLEARRNSVSGSRPWTYIGIGPTMEGNISSTLPSEFLTSEEAVVAASAAKAIALAKKAAKVAKDTAAMMANHHSTTRLDNPKNETTPSNEELELFQAQMSVSIAVRSKRQLERKVRRMRASERAAANSVSVKSGFTSRKKRASLQDVNSSDPLRYLRGTTSGSKLLTTTEEMELSEGIQELLKLEKLNDKLTKRCGGPPSFVQWAAAAGVDKKTLRKRISYGTFCKDKMIKSNIRLVISIAKNYQGAGMNLQDLVQEGCRGLVRGAEKFDASKGFKFSTYAHWWIKQAVRKSLSDQSRTIRLPVHMVEAAYKVKEARKQLYSENQRQPDNEEVAEATGLTMKKLQAVLLAPKPPRSLDQKFGINQNLKPSDVIADPEAKTLDEILLEQLMRQDLEKVLETLNTREKQVVRLRFGLEDGKMKTLREIGVVMGVCRERIRQIESGAFRKLKSKKRAKHLQQYMFQIQ